MWTTASGFTLAGLTASLLGRAPETPTSTSVCPRRPEAPVTPAAAWAVAVVPRLRDAEELLDHLEAHGFRERELHVLGGSAFEVRWR